MKITNIIAILITIISFSIAIIYYDSMPNQMASHWNSSWEVNDHIAKIWWLFIMPLLSLITYLLFLIIPKIDPLKNNIEKFRPYYDRFLLIILIFFLYIYSLTIYWNLWNNFDMNLMILPAISFFFYSTWIIMCKAKRNWFIGIRTPWTLSSDRVWAKTNRLWWRLFKILSFISLVCIFIWNNSYKFLIGSTIVVAIFLIIYSYVEYWDEVM